MLFSPDGKMANMEPLSKRGNIVLDPPRIEVSKDYVAGFGRREIDADKFFSHLLKGWLGDDRRGDESSGLYLCMNFDSKESR